MPGSPRLRTVISISIAVLTLTLAAAAASAQVLRGADLSALSPLFPPDHWWNVDVSAAPLDLVNGTNYTNFIGPTRGLHPDFGGDVDPANPASTDIYGMVYISVPGTQPLEPVTFVEFDDQSDHGAPGRPAGYPIPVEARTEGKWIEGGDPGGGASGDHHMLIVDRDNRILYELYHAHWNAALARWEAGSGAIFSLDSDARRPDTWTSADAAGLAILPGLIRYDEAFGPNPIRHAFRFTVRDTNGYVYPASHEAGSRSGAPPMGTRLRLKAGTVVSPTLPAYVQKIFQAMKTYGLIVADNGSDMYIQGAYDPRWDNGVLNPAFSGLKASDFEVIAPGWQPPVATAAGPLQLYTVPPCRLLDTRNPSGPAGGPALPPGGQRVLTVTSRCGIPAAARAVAVNVTVVAPPQAGHIRFFPGNAQAPNAAALNFGAGQTRTNNAILMLASSGTGTLAVQSFTSGGFLHLVLDVTGYFQ
ncbi:MAG TPA: hypothetical protein VGR07_11085 [Thermoanaerobaculia bacterium]|nr:hypothetical protein [Thermoanaerobaculia bacterium]